MDDMLVTAKNVQDVIKLKSLVEERFWYEGFGCCQKDYWHGESTYPLVVGHMDLYYVGDLDYRMSTIGYIFTLRGGSICWKSIVQSIVALSTIKMEYIVVAKVAKEALWLKGLVRESSIEQGRVRLHCDS